MIAMRNTAFWPHLPGHAQSPRLGAVDNHFHPLGSVFAVTGEAIPWRGHKAAGHVVSCSNILLLVSSLQLRSSTFPLSIEPSDIYHSGGTAGLQSGERHRASSRKRHSFDLLSAHHVSKSGGRFPRSAHMAGTCAIKWSPKQGSSWTASVLVLVAMQSL